MAERLWSGPGCDGDPAFEFVKHSDSGVPLYRKIAPGEVEVETEDGGTIIAKRADPAPEKEVQKVHPHDAVDTAIERLAKAEFPDEPPAQAVEKFLRTEAGAALYGLRDTLGAVRKADTRFEKVTAHAMLEGYAAEIRKANPRLSAEAAYAEAMNQHPEVAAAAVG